MPHEKDTSSNQYHRRILPESVCRSRKIFDKADLFSEKEIFKELGHAYSLQVSFV